ncbi:MAG: patatin-like phospholipase family protein [Actinomycetota bacterium]|nr:patatin-like phospholipase family protein [Actinomycetota bacterium]
MSLDGGGIRGLITARIISEIEERTGKFSSELFDLIAGTSTGGLLALAIAAPGSTGEPAARAANLIRVFEQAEKNIFVRRGAASFGIMHERYHSESFERYLHSYFGETMLSQAICDTLVTSYDLLARDVVIWSRFDARGNAMGDVPFWLAARSTTAAPTYFDPARIDGGLDGDRSFIDGVMAANNPAMCAYAHSVKVAPDRRPFIVSIGTGVSDHPTRRKSDLNWGAAHWAKEILHVLIEGSSEVVDWQLREILGRGLYRRIQGHLDYANEAIDDTSVRNLEALHVDAENWVRIYDREIDCICEVLSLGR